MRKQIGLRLTLELLEEITNGAIPSGQSPRR
jgi:hypothetical protein